MRRNGWLQQVADTSVEAFYHAVGLGVAWLGEAVFSLDALTGFVEFMLACGVTFPFTGKAVGEFLPIVGQHVLHLDGEALLYFTQKSAVLAAALSG